jgi:dienelactone hydrolase
MNRFTRLPTVALASLLACATASRAEVQTKEVEYKQGDTRLVGLLAWDDSVAKADAKLPGVVVFPEWWGLTDHPKDRAKQLAKLGYVALAADLYGNGMTTADPKEAGNLAGALKKDPAALRARAQAALDALKSQPNVDPGKLAAIGFCFGGTTALELAMSGADLQGVVSFHGGLDFPNLADTKNIKAKVLICNGAADTFVPRDQITAFTDALEAAKVDWVFVNYNSAVHAFTNPKADSFGIKGIAYNEKADKRSWQAMVDFFNEIFK